MSIMWDKPTDHWQMYSDKANRALEKAVQGLRNCPDRLQLEQWIGDMQKKLSAQGFGEVYDTEPEWEITDWVNEHVCKPRKWQPVDRWEF